MVVAGCWDSLLIISFHCLLLPVDIRILPWYCVFWNYQFYTKWKMMKMKMVNLEHKKQNKSFWINLGRRIKEERKRAGLTQIKLMEAIGRSPNSYRVLGRWEKGSSKPEFSDMIKMAEVFECDFGYLIGEYDCRTGVATDIKAEIGLSEKAIQRLRVLKKGVINDYLYIISLLITEAEEIGGEYQEESTVLDEIVKYIGTIITDKTVCISTEYNSSWDIPGSDIEDLGLLQIQIKMKQLKAWCRGDDLA